jgi:hypothetical protein
MLGRFCGCDPTCIRILCVVTSETRRFYCRHSLHTAASWELHVQGLNAWTLKSRLQCLVLLHHQRYVFYVFFAHHGATDANQTAVCPNTDRTATTSSVSVVWRRTTLSMCCCFQLVSCVACSTPIVVYRESRLYSLLACWTFSRTVTVVACVCVY